MLQAAVAIDKGGGGGGRRRQGRRGGGALVPGRATCTDEGTIESIYNLLPKIKEETVCISGAIYCMEAGGCRWI